MVYAGLSHGYSRGHGHLKAPTLFAAFAQDGGQHQAMAGRRGNHGQFGVVDVATSRCKP
jgi:hypothetical protein